MNPFIYSVRFPERGIGHRKASTCTGQHGSERRDHTTMPRSEFEHTITKFVRSRPNPQSSRHYGRLANEGISTWIWLWWFRPSLQDKSGIIPINRLYGPHFKILHIPSNGLSHILLTSAVKKRNTKPKNKKLITDHKLILNQKEV
jgi:hypothetical protein